VRKLSRRFFEVGTSLKSLSLLVGVCAAIVVSAPPTAHAVQEFYTIDSEASFVELDATSRVEFQFFGVISGVSVPLLTQVGSGGTAGTLPDGSTSDGLRTALQGRLLIDVTPSGNRELEIINRRSSIELLDSGSWLPGLPGTEATAAPAALAARFPDPTLMFDGQAAIRGGEFSIGHSGFGQSLTDQGGGTFTFPFGFGLSGSAPLAPFPVDGTWDYETSLVGAVVSGGRGRLVSRATDMPFILESTGTLVEEAGGGRQVTIPINGAVFIGEDSFEVGVPALLRLELRGQVVAQTPLFVPEPGAGMSGLTMAGVLALLKRRSGRRRLSYRQWLRRVTVSMMIFGLAYMACNQGVEEGDPGVIKVEPGVDCTAGAMGEETEATYDADPFFFDEVSGLPACAVGTTASGSGTQGNITVEGEASVQSFFINVNSQQAKFEISCQTVITGGALSAPTACNTQVTEVITHSGSSTNDTISIGAWQHSFGAGASTPVTATARVDCGVGPPVALPVNGGNQQVPVEDVNFTCTVFATLQGGTDAEGETVQTLNVVAMPTPVQCETHFDCRESAPSTPFCVTGLGCTDGSLGTECAHDSQCDDTLGLFCSAGLTCDDGGEGSSCQGVGDCGEGLTCESFQCSAGD
jgi:hypothetical protein